jgi:HlyD family secretion protein
MPSDRPATPRSRRKVALAVAASAAVLAFAAWILRPQPVAVDVATVTRGALESYVEDQARTRVADHYVVSAPLAGVISRITLTEGDPVEAGAVIATLYPAAPALLDARTRDELRGRLESADATRRRAQATLAATEVQLEQARADLARTESLASRGLVAAARLLADRLATEARARELDAARQALHAATHDADVARAALGRSTSPGGEAAWLVRAPAGGRIARVHQKSESAVALGAPLVEIADPAAMEVLAEMLTTDAVRIAPGAPVTLTGWGGTKALAGRVRRVEPLAFTKVSALGIEEQRVNVLIDLLTPPAERSTLGEGYRLDAHVRVYRADDVLRIPTGALFERGGEWWTYVVERDRAWLRRVEIGVRNGDAAEVRAGLSAGERVVLYPSDAVADGVRVAGGGK